MATARVACCAALVGCVPTKTPPDTAADSGAATDSPADTAIDSLEECTEHVTEVFAEASPAPSDATEECCQTITEDYDTRDLEGMETWTERDDCCELLEWQGSMACTPWGPPCPPAMAAVA
ncbi:MAG: hypothetical protein GY913_15645 [Proteobacteria bacterium]|nr:hypothetical protein [Pseudomonadota bacterium]